MLHLGSSLATMGSRFSSEKRAKEEKMKRENLYHELREMQYSLHVTATSHYIACEYYRNLDNKLQYASAVTGTLGSMSSVASKLAWKTMIAASPRLAPILVAISTTSLLFTAVVHVPQVKNSPANLYQAHFKSGIECQYLEKQVKFFTQTEVWDSSVAWTTLASRYGTLIKNKMEVNSRIQSEYWAYRAALRKIKNREKEKKMEKDSERKDNEPAHC